MSSRSILLIVALASTAHAQNDPFGLPASNARLYLAVEDGKKLAQTHLPLPDELGPGWTTPWESKIPWMAEQGEFLHWQNVRHQLGESLWPWFYGRSEADAKKLLRTKIGALEADLPTAPALSDVASAAGMFRIQLAMSRMANSVIVDSEPVAALRAAPLFDQGLVLGQSNDPGEIAEALRAMFAEYCPETGGLDTEPMLAAVARDATLVRKFATTTYVHTPEDFVVDEDTERVPEFGQFKVDVYVVRRGAIGAEIKDLTAAEIGELRAALESHVNAVARRFTPELGGTYRVQWEPRDLGDDAWLVTTKAWTAHEALPSYAALYGRIRNGNAIINVKGEGTYPAEWLAKQLDYLLSVIDEGTAQFGEEDWE